MEKPSSQMAKGILGDSFFGHASYYLFQFSTALILAVAAILAFQPSLCWPTIWLKTSTCPISLWKRGSPWLPNGILTLAFGAMILLLIFNGNTERLIPLYTIGVFVPFALSQTGMIRHWKRKRSKLLKTCLC